MYLLIDVSLDRCSIYKDVLQLINALKFELRKRFCASNVAWIHYNMVLRKKWCQLVADRIPFKPWARQHQAPAAIQDALMWSSADQCINMPTMDERSVIFDGKAVPSIIATYYAYEWNGALNIASIPTRPPPTLRPCNLDEDCKLNGVIWSSIGGDMSWCRLVASLISRV